MPRHWLESVVRKAKVPYADDLLITPGAGTAQAWKETMEQLRLEEDDLAELVAKFFHVKRANLDAVSPAAAKLVPEKLVRQFNVLPLRQNDREIVVATIDPGDMGAEQAIGFAAGRSASFEIATPSALTTAIATRYPQDGDVQAMISRVKAPAQADISGGIEPELAGARTGDSAAVTRLTNLIFQDALARGASMISIFPGENGGAVTFRVNGVTGHFMNMSIIAMNHVVARLRMIGQIGMGDRVRSRGGAARVDFGGKAFELRIQVTPSHGTQRADVTIVDPAFGNRLEDLSWDSGDLERLRAMAAAPTGLIVIAGPEHTGRSTLAYALMRELAAARRTVVSVEQQVNADIPGVRQLEINPQKGLTTIALLQAASRESANVLVVEDLNDADAARHVVAAMDERLVIVTLRAQHTLDALARIAALGFDRGRLGQSLRGIIALRLLRRLCANCREAPRAPQGPDEGALATAYQLSVVPVARGCPKCAQSGYRGVVPVVETLVATDALRAQIGEGASLKDLARTALSGGARSLLNSARERVRAGDTDARELERVLGTRQAMVRPTRARPMVLVADDEPETRLLARAILENAGYAVAEAEDGARVLELVHASADFALLILDLNMPRVDGREALARLKGQVATAGLPVVVLTASPDPSDEQRVMEEGADDYIRKPIDPVQFVERVSAVLRRHVPEAAAHG